jgi:hypothetical protein
MKNDEGQQHEASTYAKRLQQHVASTYRNLRFGLAGISIAFPLFLWLTGWLWYGIPLQGSMSAYYFAESPGEGPLRSWLTSIDVPLLKDSLFALAGLDGEAPMRSWFVGTLFVLGVCLYLYKGFSDRENYLLNAAGLLAIGVALFPMEVGCDPCHTFTFHGIFAIGAFVCMVLVALWCSKDTLHDLPERQEERERRRNDNYEPGRLMPIFGLIVSVLIKIIDIVASVYMRAVAVWRRVRGTEDPFRDLPTKRRYRDRYHVTGVLMLIFPVIAWVLTTILNDDTKFIFFVELLGLWSFAVYWLIKSMELEDSQAEIRAIEKTSEIPSALAAQSGAKAAPAPPVRTEV